ncbi:MAG TPA: hypothetical protein VMS88_06315, partial [Terriglobales bacterium]|nr:hypothetical protein [Terriglobales bacterium]
PAAALLAQGIGIPAALGGTDEALPDSVVLSSSEAAGIRATLNAYNAAIVSEATARGAAVVDLHGLLVQAATTGIEVKGVRYSSAFLTGGLFSLDGVHPSDLAHGLIANQMIDAVNAKFGASIPRVDLTSAATATASRLRPARGEGAAGPMRVEGLGRMLRALFPRR